MPASGKRIPKNLRRLMHPAAYAGNAYNVNQPIPARARRSSGDYS